MTFTGPIEQFDRIRQAQRLRLFLDYDGTLAEFAATPDEIYPDKELIELLGKLNDTPHIQPAVISGRRLDQIRTLVPVPGMWLAGTYGIELLDPSGKYIDRVDFDKVRPVLEEIKPLWQALLDQQPDLYLEDKEWSLALHAKFVPKAQAADILEQAKTKLNRVKIPNGGFRILGGDKFLEIAPCMAHKGLAIDYLVSKEPLDGALLVYIGDDDKDEEAFETIFKYHGLAIKVCIQPCATKAQLQISNPVSVREFLASIL